MKSPNAHTSVLPQSLTVCCEQKDHSSTEYTLVPNPPLIAQNLFMRSPVTLTGCPQIAVTSLSISWLTISNTTVTFRNIHFHARLEVLGGKLTCTNCTFSGFRNDTESPVELCAGAHSFFKDCTFASGLKTSVFCRDQSHSVFSDCIFQGTTSISLLVSAKSNVTLQDCSFSGAPKFAAYLHGQSRGHIERCRFLEQTGRGLILLADCECAVVDCHFEGNEGGSVALVGSKIRLVNTTFTGLHDSGVHVMSGSTAEIEGCHMESGSGKGVVFDCAVGSVRNCAFSDLGCAVSVLGASANPVIAGSRIVRCCTAVIARDACAPLFSSLTIEQIAGHAFTLSDFSCVSIRHCTISTVESPPFAVYNGACPTIEHCHIDCRGNKAFTIFTNGQPVFRKNVFTGTSAYLCRNGAFFTTSQFVGNSLLLDGIHYELKAEQELLLRGALCAMKCCVDHCSESHLQPQALVDIDAIAVSAQCSHCVCLHCHQRDAALMCAPCGHRIICAECAEKVADCPLCGANVIRYVKVFEESVCSICLDADADTVMLGCGHKCVCYGCATRLWMNEKKCPICQSRVSAYRHEFGVDDCQKDTTTKLIGEQQMADAVNLIRTNSWPISVCSYCRSLDEEAADL
jgi:hypothetical protein